MKVLGAAVAAGMAGTGVMMAIRKFDAEYAPKTVSHDGRDPGAFVVQTLERATGTAGLIPQRCEKPAAFASHAIYGTMFGIAYGLLRGKGRRRSALFDGVLLGGAVYAIGFLGWLPAFGLTRPVWKQRFPEVAGELLRHTVYGVATTTVYGLIDAIL
jgi:uncharacterized membrane protein YagU involved in acid resistance